jgi:hypothetical protein
MLSQRVPWLISIFSLTLSCVAPIVSFSKNGGEQPAKELSTCNVQAVEDGELRKLLEAYRDSVAQAIVAKTASSRRGQFDDRELSHLIRDHVDACLELAKTKAERMEIMETYLKQATAVNVEAKAKAEAEIGSHLYALLTTTERIRAEIALHKERKAP